MTPTSRTIVQVTLRILGTLCISCAGPTDDGETATVDAQIENCTTPGACEVLASSCDTSGRGRSVTYTTNNQQPSTITFEFSCDGGDCRCGRFATGWDYWVAPMTKGGKVTITAMKPNQTGSGLGFRNGYVIDPSSRMSQGFDGRPSDAAWSFAPPKAPPFDLVTKDALPQVILKARSNAGSDNCNKSKGADKTIEATRTCLVQVESLTVLASPPPNNGATVLRPPYYGKGYKPMHDVSNVNLGLLPELPFYRAALGWDRALARLRSPAVDYFGFSRFHESFAPAETHDFSATKDVNAAYPGKWTPAANEPYLQLTLAASTAADRAKKRQLALRGIQRGSDLYAIIYHSYRNGGSPDEGWGAAGYGHGRVGPIVFAATLLNKKTGTDPKDNWIALLKGLETTPGRRSAYSEIAQIRFDSETKPATPLFGTAQPCGGGSRTCADPAGNIDGGGGPAALCPAAYQGYQSWSGWFAEATWIRLIPAVDAAFPHRDFLRYIDRMAMYGDFAPGGKHASLGGTVCNYGGDTRYASEDGINPIAKCKGGTMNGKVCNESSQCGGGSCIRPKQSNAPWNINDSYFARVMWEAYRDCSSKGTCP